MQVYLANKIWPKHEESQVRFLETLLTEKEHWLPSLTGTYVRIDNQTTNRVEGFFGALKNLLEHNIQTLANVANAMYNRAERP